MGFETIVQSIQILPPLPESVHKVQKLFSTGDADVQKLIKIIEADPIMTANILAEANSPLYNFSKQIVSITQAITLFGTASIRSLILASAIKDNFTLDLSPYGLSTNDFSKISNIQSTLMYQWYMGVDMQKAKDLTPLAFLLEMGKIVIANEINKSEYSELFLDEVKQKESIDTLENFYAEVTSSKINALLFAHWNFEELFVEVMEYLDAPIKDKEYLLDYANALKVVRTAVNVHEQLTEESIENATKLAESLGYDATRFNKTSFRIKEKLDIR